MQHARKIETMTELHNLAQPLPADYKPYNEPPFKADAEVMSGMTQAQFWRLALVGLTVFWGSILWAVFH